MSLSLSSTTELTLKQQHHRTKPPRNTNPTNQTPPPPPPSPLKHYWNTKPDPQTHHLNTKLKSQMGTLAIEIGNLTKLKGLLLFKNQISDEIPESFGNLKALDLSDNRISGPIPSELANLKELTQLRLMNKLSYRRSTSKYRGFTEWSICSNNGTTR